MRPNLFNWNKLKTFYHVVKAGSFTSAADLLNISQSAVSRSIISLEERVGHKLFKRLPRGLALSKHGEILFRNAQKMFVFSELAQTEIQAEGSMPQGRLTVGANVGLVDTWLLDVVPGFLKEYPDINLSVVCKDSFLDVESFEVDVALQPYSQNSSGLVQTFLMSWHRKLYASKEYLKKFGTPKTPSDLDNHRLIGFGFETIHLFKNLHWHLEIGCKPGSSRQAYATVNSVRALFNFANSGLGIIGFSEESPLLPGSNLVQILPEVKGPRIDIYIAYSNQLKNIKRIKVLEDYLKQEVAANHKSFQAIAK